MFATPESVDHLMQLLIHHISHATSSQLGRMRETERALATRRREIEQAITPTVIAPRPTPGESRLREQPALPPRPPRRARPRREAAAMVARPAAGTITTIAGHEVEDGFADGPALEARFGGIVELPSALIGRLHCMRDSLLGLRRLVGWLNKRTPAEEAAYTPVQVGLHTSCSQ